MNARHLSVLAALAACTFAHFAANAAEVSSAEAREAVAGWAALGDALTGAERFGGREIADVATYEGADGNGAFHVVSFVGGSFAVMSGDTEVTPILAYSEEGEFAATEENEEGEELMTVNVSRSGKVTIGDEEDSKRR